jgi:cytochrome P450
LPASITLERRVDENSGVPAAAEADISVEELLPDFDFFNPLHAPRGAEVLRYAREKCPVPHTTATGGYYIATTYDDVTHVLSDQVTYSSHEYVHIAGSGGILLPPIDADPPLHHDFRLILNPFFHPKYLAASEVTMREIARATMSSWVDTGHSEFVGDFAAPFVTDVLAKVVFAADDPELFREAADCNDRVSEGDASAFPRFRSLMEEFLEKHPARDGGGDIVSAIVGGTVADRPLTKDEKVGVVQILFSGGLDTTKVAISDIICEIAQRPGLEDRLREPGWEKTTLDELLRYSSPVGALGRLVTRDAQLGDKQLHAGDRVLVYYGSANRDSKVFEEPDELVFDRTRNPHVAFGLGIHRCIGIHLARMQVRVALSEVLDRITRIRLAPGASLERRPGISKIIRELNIEFDPR